MSKYLYGAAVQGIQSFIFQTNELKDIVGASELVEQICSKLFADILGKTGDENLQNDENAIVHAAGNIKYIFDDEQKCREVVRNFPRIIQEHAPGITASQAVVEFDDMEKFAEAVQELEQRLRAQRNCAARSQTLGLMGIERSRQTGLPCRVMARDDSENGSYLDASTYSKLYEVNNESRTGRRRTTYSLCKKIFGNDFYERFIAYDIKNLTEDNDWIAVIHADGNGLGQIVQKVGTDSKKFKDFSEKLNEATVRSAQEAFVDLARDKKLDKCRYVPFRPIVVGGDDLTVICRADLAVDFVKMYIEKFEYYSSQIIKDEAVFTTEGKVHDCLTACAGIAYMKSAFPFYYGYEMAESLCDVAKKDAKRSDEVKEGKALPASCIMFHKIQDSFTESYADIVKRELTSKEDPRRCLSFGPYYVNASDELDGRWTIEELLSDVQLLESNEGNAVKSALRQWLTLFMDNFAMAEQRQFRMDNIILNRSLRDMARRVTKSQERDGKLLYPVYDILALHTINTQVTK